MIKYFLVFSLLFCPLFGKTKQEPKYYLSICAVFRNEARFLKEWIEYHRMMGVEHFYLFNHLSDDEYKLVLEPYIKEGIIELFNVRKEMFDFPTWISMQTRLYNIILEAKKQETFWLAFIDTDEFILPLKHKDLPTFLQKYEGYGGIGIHWQGYGTSDIERIPDEQTMIGTLIKKAPPNFSWNHFIKMIVHPPYVKSVKNPHFCDYKKSYFQVNELGEKQEGAINPNISIEMIRINHYTFRDQEFYYKEKMRRKVCWSSKPNFSISPPDPSLSEVEDPIILQYVPELENRLFRVEAQRVSTKSFGG